MDSLSDMELSSTTKLLAGVILVRSPLDDVTQSLILTGLTQFSERSGFEGRSGFTAHTSESEWRFGSPTWNNSVMSKRRRLRCPHGPQPVTGKEHESDVGRNDVGCDSK
jgi:hypothetical protein